jgi:arylsulfatase A-like enzyme
VRSLDKGNESMTRSIQSVLFATIVLACGADVVVGAKPNVLVIVSDDQGYVDAGFQGGMDVPTPNLDRLAASGVRCTSGYVTHPFCSPTRAGLMTGRYQARFGHEYNPVYDPLDPQEGLPLSERILPQYLEDLHYKTGWVGKWHLGASPSHAPWARGFQETFGFIGGGHAFTGWKPNEKQYTLPLIRSGKSIEDVPDHLTHAFGNEAAKFIDGHRSEPWFLYVAFNAPHTPHQPTAERETKFAHVENAQRRKYLAQMSLLDDAIGSINSALETSGQKERTLVFFFSDNGGPVRNGADNGSLRGQKGQVYEGGIRVPFLVSWPEKLTGNKSFDAPVSSLDVLATALSAAGGTMPQDKKYDSVNLLPYLTGEQQGEPHSALFWRAELGKSRAVRQGKWKLVRTPGRDELYDLQNDMAEKNDLASEKHEVLAKLSATLEAWTSELVEPVFLGSSVKNEDWGPGGANQKNAKRK